MGFDKKNINKNGDLCKRGESSKFYCGKLMNAKCGCCVGYCGPGNGCNCKGCMAMDVEYRGLGKGLLVNREGFTAQIINAQFYCGRSVCNPDNKNQCNSCKILTSLKNTRYEGLY